jgi:hypothetical protein
MWLVAAIIALTMTIINAIGGKAYGSYLYITFFTAFIAIVMYYFKKKNRIFLEKHYKDKGE